MNTTLDDLASVIGFTATLRLSAWLGGVSNIYVPEVPEEGQLLVRLIGMPAAKALAKEWPREHLAVPTLDVYETLRRQRLICRLLELEMSPREIARTIGLSERRVQQMRDELVAKSLLENRGAKRRGGMTPPRFPEGE